MHQTKSPVGQALAIPERLDEDDMSFSLNDIEGAASYYREQGYAVIRGVIPAATCADFLDEFRKSVKPYAGVIDRISGQSERHVFNAQGHMTNAIRNIQKSSEGGFRKYQAQTLDMLTHKNLQRFLSAFHGPRMRLLSCNHFEANPETYAHQDCFFGKKEVGDVIGAWVALEDIHVEAGRLYVCPFSHTLDVPQIAKEKELPLDKLYPGDPAYRRLMLRLLEDNDVVCKAPYMAAGDVIFWDSRTIHGSLVTTKPQHSRSSFTAHYESTRGEPWVPSSMGRHVHGVEIGNLPERHWDLLDRAWLRLRKLGGYSTPKRTPKSAGGY